MSSSFRGADLVARVLSRAGHSDIYSLSGNHIMPLYDAMFETKARIFHTRHEAATVHMADAHARLTSDVGIALVTGGQGHTNAVAGLTTAQCADAPVVLLSGHAPTTELGRGSFQEMAQADLARPVTKASTTAMRADRLGHDIAAAISTARSGRPGPVHLSLPSDLLEAKLDDAPGLYPAAEAFAGKQTSLSAADVSTVWDLIRTAQRPLLLAGPLLCTPRGRAAMRAASAALGVPVIGMESPRGINDPGLGAFADVLKDADLIVLLSKPHDFTLRFCAPPFVSAAARFVVLDPDAALVARLQREKGDRVAFAAQVDGPAALAQFAGLAPHAASDWLRDVAAAVAFRPQAWSTVTGSDGKIHPAELMRAVQATLDRSPKSVFISDGGEIGQWAQACVSAERRVINGVAGSIGAALPFALAARVVEKDAPVVAVMGDGTFGFHMAEIETAVRHALPFVCVIGNDARWNAEHQIQLRDYGANRAHSCALAPTRYEQVAIALGGHGEYVTQPQEMAAAFARALASGKPAVVNVMIDGLPAPVIRRS